MVLDGFHPLAVSRISVYFDRNSQSPNGLRGCVTENEGYMEANQKGVRHAFGVLPPSG